MAATPFRVRGLNVILVVFSLLVLGGAAVFMSQGNLVNLNSGASNVVQSTEGKLVKKGSKDFAPCGGNDVNFTYGLIGAKVLAASDIVPVLTSTPKPTDGVLMTSGPRPTPSIRPVPTKTPVPTPISTPKTSACIALVVSAKLADPLVGQKVVVVGTYQKGVFYVTSISKSGKVNPTPIATPIVMVTPTPYVQVYSPNGGESYTRNQTVSISWMSGGLSSVLIYVINANGGASLINGSSANPNGGVTVYNWVANPPNFVNDPNNSSNVYKIRVMDPTGKWVDDSNGFFNINPQPQPQPVRTSIPY